MRHPALDQYDYHVWANERLMAKLHDLPEEICTKEVESVFPTILAVIEHLYITDQIWLRAMQGDTFEQIEKFAEDLRGKIEGKSLGELGELFKTVSEEYHRFIAGEDLDRTLILKHPSFGEVEMSLALMVYHVVNHGTYHRGNIAAMLRQLGQASVPTDYVYYYFEKCAVR
ncbi:Uncharacterized damage-inducible protein DinB (forms a four-helix bundle) [Marininema mesophilum]|uniref:Uncharacterized damage-inducible protein DinB (Forms a four-helix bundle) n=1 Tax=Marininema mesophilum TaxID=1048340 RepID=A0A1H3ARW1_9BACL|nr:DinB family protein [Marininema mesophilum]SDX32345.1 Uncharacterized damage-inducible protein DinB (forms a four-helix bundle) [Marininema mesophilum]